MLSTTTPFTLEMFIIYKSEHRYKLKQCYNENVPGTLRVACSAELVVAITRI